MSSTTQPEFVATDVTTFNFLISKTHTESINPVLVDDVIKPTIHDIGTNQDDIAVPEKKPMTKSPKLRIIPKVDQTWTIKRNCQRSMPEWLGKIFEIVQSELCEISDML